MFSPKAMDGEFLTIAVRHVVDGAATDVFCEWFVTALHARAKAAPPLDADSRRFLLHLARQFWGHVPRPTANWRVQAVAKIERNDACYCGSGKKYKQCCAEYATMPFPIPADAMFALALDTVKPESLTAADWAHVPALALAQAAEFWRERGDDQRVVDILGAYFSQHPKLDERSEPALDTLFTSMLELNMESERRELIDRLAKHPNKILATTARCRLCTMLTDRGDYDTAWQLFHETQRFNPTDAQLAHLEIMMLLSEGRSDEAALRGKVLGAQLRRRGSEFVPLAEVVERMGRDGMRGLTDQMADDEASDDAGEDVALWVTLAESLPKPVSTTALTTRYKIEHNEQIDHDNPLNTHVDAWITADKKLTALERKWSRQFPTVEPRLIELPGDAEVVLDELPEVLKFLRSSPDAWLSFTILDVLLRAGDMLWNETDSAKVLRANRDLALYGVAILRSLLAEEKVQVPWGVLAHRPMLRVVAWAITFCDFSRDQAQKLLLAEWLLRLNPNDNHGYRSMVVSDYLGLGRAVDALVLLDKYPNDFGCGGFDRALGLFQLDRLDDALIAWQQACKTSPLVVDFLLADTLAAAPENESGYMQLGGPEEAHEYASDRRATWQKCGALAWARTLPRPVVRPTKPAKTATKTGKTGQKVSPAASARELPVAAFTAADWKRLDSAFVDAITAHGFIIGVASSPGATSPQQWLAELLTLCLLPPPGENSSSREVKLFNELFRSIFALYNRARTVILANNNGTTLPPGLFEPLNPAQTDHAARWTLGFVHAAETLGGTWRSVGMTVKSKNGHFAPLYTLAARAPLAVGGWRVDAEDQRPLLFTVADETASDMEQLYAALATIWAGVAPFNGEQTG